MDKKFGKQKLYLYKPLETSEHLDWLKNYLTQKVWAPTLEEFNDPFEGVIKLSPQEPNDLKKRAPEFYEILWKNYKNKNPNSTEKEFEKDIDSDTFLSAYTSEAKKIYRRNYPGGIICLTSSYSNIPMWAHYANNHKGYCLIFELDFDVIKEKAKVLGDCNNYFVEVMEGNEILKWDFIYNSEIIFKFVFLKVKYNLEVCALDVFEAEKINDEYSKIKYWLQNSIGVKFKQWEYEEEYRLILSQNSKIGGLIHLPTYADFLKITGVIVGEKLKNTSTFNIIEVLAKSHSVNLYQAVCSKERYEIDKLHLF